MDKQPNFGVLMRGGVSVRNVRREDDFYPTPPDATLAFLDREWPHLTRMAKAAPFFIWECACGDGAIARLLEGNGWTVWSTDLRDRGFGLGGVDFLSVRTLPTPNTAIITNPPFGEMPRKFIEHAMGLGAPYLALYLKADWFNSRQGMQILERYPLARCHPLSWRVDFADQGRPVMNTTWFVWDASARPMSIMPLSRPDATRVADAKRFLTTNERDRI